jgi:hypothetical protein
VLIASHDVGLIERFGMRRVIIEGGRVAADTGAEAPQGFDAIPDLPSIIADRL